MKTRPRTVAIVDREGDVWHAKVVDGVVHMRLVRLGVDRFYPITDVGYSTYATADGYRALGDLLDNPTEPVPTLQRKHTASNGLVYRVNDGVFQYEDLAGWQRASLQPADILALADLLNNPTEEIPQ